MSDHIDPLDALTRELARVSVSPDFAAQVRSRIAEDEALGLDRLKDELAIVSVSPEFAVRVRQQIEAAPSHSRWFGWFNWRWAVPLAAAAVVLAAVALGRGSAPTKPNAVSPASVQAGASQLQTPQFTPPPSSTGTAPQALPPALVSTARATQRTATPAAASGKQADDKLEVITNQPAVLQRLWARAGPGAELVGGIEGVAVTSGEIVFPPIEVSPIVVKSLIDPEATAPGSTPIIRRVTAEQAERSPR
jgi:hypothetical protein